MSHAIAAPRLAATARPVPNDIHIIWYVLVIVMTGMVLAIQTWGVVALTMAALAMVPAMFVLIIIMSRP